MREVKQFTTDMVGTILYFAYTPLQYLFWRMPKMYEAVVDCILFFKYLLPSRTELHYTLLYWQIAVLSFAASTCNTTAKLFIMISNLVNQIRRKKLSRFQYLGKSID